jgi:hypothetical protein
MTESIELTAEELANNLEVVLATLRYTRSWHRREQDRYDFHPVIKEVMLKFKPADYLLLALEYPHQSLRDASNVAYTQNERNGTADRQTVTTFGRYIRKHFPDMKDHEVRDYTTKCIGDIFEVWETSDDIVRSVQLGPKSCMTWGSEYTPGTPSYDSSLLHPYRVYDPELGWKSVVRLDPNTRQINGRGLVLHGDNRNIFVRTYKRGHDYSYADEAMEMWLKESGYEHLSEWPNGTKLKRIPFRGSVLAPYIDGDTQCGEESGSHLVITERGSYDFTSTEGVPYNADSNCECESCNDYFDEDDMSWVEDGLTHVCDGCRDDYYVEAMGRRHSDYYHQDNCIRTVNGDYYHEDWYQNHDIVELEDGRFEQKSDCYETTCGDWVLKSDYNEQKYPLVVNGTVYLDSEVFYCHATDQYFVAEDNECVEVDGVTYHADKAPVTEEESK